MELTIKINLDNDAMIIHPVFASAILLDMLSNQLKNDVETGNEISRSGEIYHPISDINGNRIGYIQIQ